MAMRQYTVTGGTLNSYALGTGHWAPFVLWDENKYIYGAMDTKLVQRILRHGEGLGGRSGQEDGECCFVFILK